MLRAKMFLIALTVTATVSFVAGGATVYEYWNYKELKKQNQQLTVALTRVKELTGVAQGLDKEQDDAETLNEEILKAITDRLIQNNVTDVDAPDVCLDVRSLRELRKLR